MSSTAVAALPANGDVDTWSDSEKALVEAAGLTQGNGPQKRFAPRPVVEAFLMHARRTGLDPIARQIYCIERGGKWGTQVSIDGARLVAERTGQYRGQVKPQWTDGTMTKVPLREDGRIVRDGAGNPIMVDDYLWVDVWLQAVPPRAARAGVNREGFAETLYATANWDAYNANSPIWKKMPALMLAKCAEMLALRQAFPQDLSGLYSTEEMDQAGAPKAAAVVSSSSKTPPVHEVIATPELTRDWVKEAAATGSLGALTALAEEADGLGEIGLKVSDTAGLVIDVLKRRRKELEQPPLVDEPVAAPQPRKWLREARLMTNPDDVRALYMEAVNAKVDHGILDELHTMTQSMPDPAAQEPQEAGVWAKPDIAVEDSWVEDPPGSGEYRESGVPAVLQGGDEQ